MLDERVKALSVENIRIADVYSQRAFWKYNKNFIIRSRSDNLLFYNIDGHRKYLPDDNSLGSSSLSGNKSSDNSSFMVNPGDVVFMPTGCSYKSLTTDKDGNTALNVIFNIYGNNNEEIILDNKPGLLNPDIAPQVARNMCDIYEAFLQGGFANLLVMEHMYKILHLICTNHSYHNSSKPSFKSIMPAVRHMQANLNKPVSIEYLASLCFLSRSTFLRKFKSEFNDSPFSYHLKMRISKCHELLKSNLYSVEALAELMGFYDKSHFLKTMKKYTRAGAVARLDVNMAVIRHDTDSVCQL